MKPTFRLLSITFLLFALTYHSFSQKVEGISKEHNDSKMQWWKEARFGMFIHWGVYSILGRGEWNLYQEHIPFTEYALLADQFNPKQYNPKEWVAKAKEAGMKYIVLPQDIMMGFVYLTAKYLILLHQKPEPSAI